MAISRQDRAKQFMAFDALKGLQEAYREKEYEYEEKIELTEERKEEISKIINSIEIEDNIKIKYYNKRKYKIIEGKVKNIDKINKKITLEDKNNINIENILNIEIIY